MHFKYSEELHAGSNSHWQLLNREAWWKLDGYENSMQIFTVQEKWWSHIERYY